MMIKRIYLDKHLSIFGAVSTLAVGQLHIKEMVASEFGALVTVDNLSYKVKRTILVPWTSIKNCEMEDSAESAKKPAKKVANSD